MKPMRPLAGMAGLALLLGFVSQAAAADGVPRSALLAAQCNTCHGPDGNGANPNPSISKMAVGDFVELMKAFASGEQPSSIMGRHAKGYTDAEIKILAEYFQNR